MCRRRAAAEELLRFVADPQGRPALDLRRRWPGRGASVCAERACLERAGGALAKALELDPAVCSWEQLRELLLHGLRREVESDLGLAYRIGQIKSGADLTERMTRRGWSQAVALSNDVGDAAHRRFERLCMEMSIPLLELPLDAEAVGAAQGTAARSVVALGPGQLSERLRTALQRIRDSL